jgi:hypothetical protein
MLGVETPIVADGQPSADLPIPVRPTSYLYGARYLRDTVKLAVVWFAGYQHGCFEMPF